MFKPGTEEAARLTAELILDVNNDYLKYDAINVGAYDLSLGIDYLLFKVAKSRIPFLSANLYNRHGERFFLPTLVKQVGPYKVGIIGIIDDDLKMDKIPSGHKLSVADPVKTAKSLLPQLKAQGTDFNVILTDMVGGSLLKLARACPTVDLIVASDKRNQISLPVIEGATFITHLDRGGKCAGHLDIYPAGSEGHGQKVGKYLMRNSFVQLRLDIPDHPEVGPLVVERKKYIADAQRDEIADTGESTEPSGCGTKYVGEQACLECHKARHKWWEETRHAHAFSTLEKKHRQYDAECVMCHSLAFECDEGKLSLGNVEAYNNVQCESCHGPAELHVLSKGKESFGLPPSLSTCLKCHTPERSGEGGFEYQFNFICAEKKAPPPPPPPPGAPIPPA